VLFCGDLIFNAGTQRGGPVDVVAALADTVVYNGGAPLTCLA
jgi:cyclase